MSCKERNGTYIRGRRVRLDDDPNLDDERGESHFWQHVNHGCTGTCMLPEIGGLRRIFIDDESIYALCLCLLSLVSGQFKFYSMKC